LIIVWVKQYLSGVGSTGTLLFNWHPIIMSMAIFWLLVPASLIYRLSSSWKRRTRVYVHIVLQSLAVIKLITGLVIVIIYHSEASISHFYTAHSWLGLLFIMAFLGQFILGCTVEYTASSSSFMAYHKRIGKVLFAIACVTVLLGLDEKHIFISCSSDEWFCGAKRFANIIGLVVWLAAASVYYQFREKEVIVSTGTMDASVTESL